MSLGGNARRLAFGRFVVEFVLFRREGERIVFARFLGTDYKIGVFPFEGRQFQGRLARFALVLAARALVARLRRVVVAFERVASAVVVAPSLVDVGLGAWRRVGV